MTKSSVTKPDDPSVAESDRAAAETSTDSVPDPRVQTQVRKRRGLRVLFGVIGGLILLALGLVVVYFAFWTLGRSKDSQTEGFSNTIDQVIVEDVNGRVTFEAGTSTEVTVEQEWLFGDAPDVQMVENDGTLRISADCGPFCRTHVTGTALAQANIVVRTEAGSIAVTGFERGVDLTTAAGSVTVSAISGSTRLRSDAGWIRGTIRDGDVDAETSAGGIDLEVRGDFSRIWAVSDAGSVNLTVPDDVYRVEADTSAGRTEINVATAPNATRVIVARSSAGNVTIDHLTG